MAAPEIDAGWLRAARRCVSPNFDDRPDGEAVSLIVIHAISLPPSQFGSNDIECFFSNALNPAAHPYFAEIAGMRVSAHFLIRRDGELVQFVSCMKRAWHAGVSMWNGRERCNDYSIGIELEGCDELPFEEVQYLRLCELVDVLRRFYPVEAIVGHCDIAPLRKTDPGPHFDWKRLASSQVDSGHASRSGSFA